MDPMYGYVTICGCVTICGRPRVVYAYNCLIMHDRTTARQWPNCVTFTKYAQCSLTKGRASHTSGTQRSD